MYVVDEDRVLHQGRDEHWEVMSQESADGSEDEDDDSEEILERIKRDNDLAALRGDWLPVEDDSDDGEFEGDDDFSDVEEDGQGADGSLAPRERLQRKCTKPQARQGAPESSASPEFEPAAGTVATASAAAAVDRAALMRMSVPVLQRMCEARGIVVRSSTRRKHYVDALVDGDHRPCSS